MSCARPSLRVRLMAESLKQGKISGGAKQGEYFQFMVQECQRLSALIENILDFSRIEEGRKQYEFEPADLPALARETVKLMEPRATDRGVRLETMLPDAVASLRRSGWRRRCNRRSSTT